MRVPFEVNNFQLRNQLSERIAPEAFALLQKHKALQTSGGKFTHKCSCPNPLHKNGKERSASFYINKDNGQYFCFGCQIYGNAFDLLTLLGEDSEKALHAVLSQGPIELPPLVDTHALIETSYSNLTKKCRKKLQESIGTDKYKDTFEWLEKLYQKIDLILPELEKETPEQIQGRFLQLSMEVKRNLK